MNPRSFITFLFVLLWHGIVLAVSPLVTDDADTVEAGKLQLNNDFFVVRASSTTLYSVSPNRFRLEPGDERCSWRDGRDAGAKVSPLAGRGRQAQVHRPDGPEIAERAE